MKTFILSGPPGSGKSHATLDIAKRANAAGERGLILSADHYFSNIDAGEYSGIAFSRIGDVDIQKQLKRFEFDPKEIHLAHMMCRTAFRTALQGEHQYIVIDNTNIWAAEKAVYYDHASDVGDVEIIRLNPSVRTCMRRNTHDVPYSVIRKMHHVHNARDHQGNLRETMPWWNVTEY